MSDSRRQWLDVLERAFDYRKSIDPEIGDRIQQKVRAGSGAKPEEGMGEG